MLNWRSASAPLGVNDPAPGADRGRRGLGGARVSPAAVLVRKAKASKKRTRPEPDPVGTSGRDRPEGGAYAARPRPCMPTPENLSQEMADARNATKRGYFTPDEDERVRAAFAKFLKARAVLEDTILDIEELCSRRDGTFSALSERGVAGAGLIERRGVHADHGDAFGPQVTPVRRPGTWRHQALLVKCRLVANGRRGTRRHGQNRARVWCIPANRTNRATVDRARTARPCVANRQR